MEDEMSTMPNIPRVVADPHLPHASGTLSLLILSALASSPSSDDPVIPIVAMLIRLPASDRADGHSSEPVAPMHVRDDGFPCPGPTAIGSPWASKIHRLIDRRGGCTTAMTHFDYVLA